MGALKRLYSKFPLPGGKLVHDGDVVRLIDAAGKLIHTAKNDGSNPRENPEGKGVLPQQSGWVAYAYWYNTGSPINYFTTDWVVPPAPRTYRRQTVFLFNSIEPASGNAILQPVLQYGPSAAGGANYWAVASWYVVGTTAYHTSLVRVNPGQVLRGIISLTSITSGKYNYATYFSNVGGTTLTLSGSPQLVWATETLESYNVGVSTDYPSGSTVFSSIYIRTTTSNAPSMRWTTVSDSADRLFTTVNTQGPTNARITISYPS